MPNIGDTVPAHRVLAAERATAQLELDRLAAEQRAERDAERAARRRTRKTAVSAWSRPAERERLAWEVTEALIAEADAAPATDADADLLAGERELAELAAEMEAAAWL